MRGTRSILLVDTEAKVTGRVDHWGKKPSPSLMLDQCSIVPAGVDALDSAQIFRKIARECTWIADELDPVDPAAERDAHDSLVR